MTEGTRNMLVGVFVVAAAVVLGVLMVWFGEAPGWLGRAEWYLRITGVRELSGIGDGSPVNLNGVEIGRVKRIEFENPERPDRGVVIVAGIRSQYSVPEGSVARVYGATLGFGTGHIEIVVGPEARAQPLPRELAQIRGEMRSKLGEIVSREFLDALEQTVVHTGELAAEAVPVAKNLAELIEHRTVESLGQPDAAEKGFTPNIATVVERIDTLLANLNAVLGDQDVQIDVKAAVSDIKDATEELRETITLWRSESQRISENVNTRIDETSDRLDESFTRLIQVLDNLDAGATSMASLLQSIHDGEGTAGLFVRDERLYEAAVLTVERLAELVGTLHRIAGKIEQDGYITIGQKTSVGTFTKDFPVGQSPPKASSLP